MELVLEREPYCQERHWPLRSAVLRWLRAAVAVDWEQPAADSGILADRRAVGIRNCTVDILAGHKFARSCCSHRTVGCTLRIGGFVGTEVGSLRRE